MKIELLSSSFGCCLLDCFALGYYSLLDLPPRLQMYLFSDEIYCCFEGCTRDKISALSNTSPEPNPFPELTQSCCIGWVHAQSLLLYLGTALPLDMISDLVLQISWLLILSSRRAFPILVHILAGRCWVTVYHMNRTTRDFL